jgi:hypothetical protein
MNSSHVEFAARNNAIWCDPVCRAHGVPGEFLPSVWLNRNTPPPFHSNLIVISDSGDCGKSLEHIRELIDLPLSGKWSAKDSFFNLELATLGFDVLFEASWIWCDQALTYSRHSSSGIHWSRIASAVELAHWENAWEGNSQNFDTIGKPAHFPRSLLEDRQVAFFAGTFEQEIIAGGIANRTGNVVGLSNVFVNSGDAPAAWIELVKILQDTFPALPLVGYERNQELESALACGFKSIGSLRVWIRHD